MASSEQEPNLVSDQIHLVLTTDELATIVIALRAFELHGLAERLDTKLRQIGQPPSG